MRRKWMRHGVAVGAVPIIAAPIALGVDGLAGATPGSPSVTLPPVSQLEPGPAIFTGSVTILHSNSVTRTIPLSNSALVANLLAKPGLTNGQRTELESIPTTITDTISVALVNSPGLSPSSQVGSGTVSPEDVTHTYTAVVSDTPTCHYGPLGTTWFHNYQGWNYKYNTTTGALAITSIDHPNYYEGTAFTFGSDGPPQIAYATYSWGGTATEYWAATGGSNGVVLRDVFTLHQVWDNNTYAPQYRDDVSCP